MLVLVALLAALAVSACGSGDDDAGSDDGGDTGGAPDAMQQLFVDKGCAECHGQNGEGTDTARTELAGTRMIIQQFSTRVRNGKGSAMPAHTPEQITDDEIKQLYEWLKNK